MLLPLRPGVKRRRLGRRRGLGPVGGGYVEAHGSTRTKSDSGQASPGIGAGRPEPDRSAPRSSGSFTMTGGTVAPEAGAVADSGNHRVGAQAIGVNLDDKNKNGKDIGGEVTLALPYLLGEDQDPKRVTVRETGEDGSENKGESAFDAEAGIVTASASGDSGSFVLSYAPFPYKDVPRDSYFYDAVDWADRMGITTGTGPDTFSPYASCTRARS